MELYCKHLYNVIIIIVKKEAPATKKIIYEFTIKKCNILQINFTCLRFSTAPCMVRL